MQSLWIPDGYPGIAVMISFRFVCNFIQENTPETFPSCLEIIHGQEDFCVRPAIKQRSQLICSYCEFLHSSVHVCPCFPSYLTKRKILLSRFLDVWRWNVSCLCHYHYYLLHYHLHPLLIVEIAMHLISIPLCVFVCLKRKGESKRKLRWCKNFSFVCSVFLFYPFYLFYYTIPNAIYSVHVTVKLYTFLFSIAPFFYAKLALLLWFRAQVTWAVLMVLYGALALLCKNTANSNNMEW